MPASVVLREAFEALRFEENRLAVRLGTAPGAFLRGVLTLQEGRTVLLEACERDWLERRGYKSMKEQAALTQQQFWDHAAQLVAP